MNEIDQELFELEAVNAAYLKSKDRLSKGIINRAIEINQAAYETFLGK